LKFQKSQVGGGRHLVKSKYHGCGWSDFKKFGTVIHLTLLNVPTVKNFKIHDGGGRYTEKLKKSPYCRDSNL